MIASGETEPSTIIEFVSRLTEQLSTPDSPDTAFSTLAEQAAQLMPVTSYCVIRLCLLFYAAHFMSFWSVQTSSSMTLVLAVADIIDDAGADMAGKSSSLLNAFTAAFTAADWTRISGQ